MKPYKSLHQSIIDYLKNHPNQKFTANQLAEWFVNNYPEIAEKKRSNSKQDLSTHESLILQIVSEIGARKQYLIKKSISITTDRPREYYYQTEQHRDLQQNPKQDNNSNLYEKDLYPKLTTYILNEFDIYSKRIDEKKSTNTTQNANKWLHPDVVGLQPLWLDVDNNEVQQCIDHTKQNKFSLWSFEVKKALNTNNLRESFFQTVSNSSWANNAYLVTESIQEEIMPELRMLCNLHGIGVIKLNPEKDEDAGSIVIPCKPKNNLDWTSINRITNANKDFKKYIELVNYYCLNKGIIEQSNGWDEYHKEEY